MDILAQIAKRFDSDCYPYSADDVIEEFRNYMENSSMFNYMERIIVSLKQNGQLRTAETYAATLNSFKKFLCEANIQGRSGEDWDIRLEYLDSGLMESYQAWHKLRGNSPNTISFYTRILRAVYHRAVEENIIENRHPFRHVYTGVDKTVKRAISLSAVKAIKNLDLSLTPVLDYARDMFIMSFYLRGMSFIDMSFLKKSDLKNGYVVYRRRKTSQQLTIKWTYEMQSIVDKYPVNPTRYLLPIIKAVGINERCAYRNCGYNINRNLKKIGTLAGVDIPLTMYVARHSWASIAKAKGIPISVISEGMGHDSVATTQIYLASLDTAVVDRANALIISAL